MLHIEKRNNNQTTLVERRKLKRSMARQTNELLQIVRWYEKAYFSPDQWPMLFDETGQASRTQQYNNAYHDMSVRIRSAYRDICNYICNAVYSHIKTFNPDDTVHVSIKAFLEQVDQTSYVVSLGHSICGKGNAYENAMDVILESWRDIERTSYALSEDYALYRVCNDSKYRVFNCGNIDEFIKNQDESDVYGRYRRPTHLNRHYNATLVCPIYYLKDDDILILGTICVDTTSAYNDWNSHNSYEEELLTFVSSIISSLLHRNISEYNKAESILRKIS